MSDRGKIRATLRAEALGAKFCADEGMEGGQRMHAVDALTLLRTSEGRKAAIEEIFELVAESCDRDRATGVPTARREQSEPAAPDQVDPVRWLQGDPNAAIAHLVFDLKEGNPHARPALRAYADSCRHDDPELARWIRAVLEAVPA